MGRRIYEYAKHSYFRLFSSHGELIFSLLQYWIHIQSTQIIDNKMANLDVDINLMLRQENIISSTFSLMILVLRVLTDEKA